MSMSIGLWNGNCISVKSNWRMQSTRHKFILISPFEYQLSIGLNEMESRRILFIHSAVDHVKANDGAPGPFDTFTLVYSRTVGHTCSLFSYNISMATHESRGQNHNQFVCKWNISVAFTQPFAAVGATEHACLRWKSKLHLFSGRWVVHGSCQFKFCLIF